MAEMGAGVGSAGAEVLPELEIPGPVRQRRATVLLRWLLLIPQFIVLYLVGIAAQVVAIIGWFAALVLGRLPEWAAEFLVGYLGWAARVGGSAMLLVDRYPPFGFDPGDYPVDLQIVPGRLNRLAVFFRIILAIPAAIVVAVLSYGWAICALFCWLVVLVLGYTPTALFGATAAVLRYSLRYQAYVLLVTSAYPKHIFGDPPQATPTVPVNMRGSVSATRPLVLSAGARTLLIVFLVLGSLVLIGVGIEDGIAFSHQTQQASSVHTTPVRHGRRRRAPARNTSSTLPVAPPVSRTV